MSKSWINGWGLASLLLGAALFCTGCESKGPAEKAGENIDQGVQNIQNSVNPKGPAEKAGESVDKALGK